MAAKARTAERPTQSAPHQAPRDNLPAAQEAKQKAPIVQFRDYVNQRMMTLEETLPPHINSTFFVSAIMVALQKKPSLLKCTFASIWNACVEAAKDGLLPDGKEGAIVPYGENADGRRVAELATWMPMIEGYRKKVFEAGKVKAWEVQVVREKDEFEYELGDNAFIRHRPYIGTQSPGNVVGAWSVAKLISGEIVREVMGAYDIMQIASKSRAGNGPWKDPAFVPEMARKVVARRHYKQLPHSRELSEMFARDDERFGIDFNEADEALPKREPPRRLSARQAFDAYAGATVDNETGEVIDDGDRDIGEDPAPRQNAGPAAQADPATEAARTEADTNDQPQDGGDDRPWPPGTLPTNESEYERYLDTQIAAITDGSKVAPWWNSREQKELRKACNVVRFRELQDKAIARRKQLDDQPVR